MNMTPEEIVRHYNQAKNKAKDIRTLADFNCVAPSEIRAVLVQAGVPGVAAPRRAPRKPQEAPMEPMPEAPAEPAVYASIEAVLAALPDKLSMEGRKQAAELLSTLFSGYLAARLGLREEGAADDER